MKTIRIKKYWIILEVAGGAITLALALSLLTSSARFRIVLSLLLDIPSRFLWWLLPIYLLADGCLLLCGKRAHIWFLATVGGRQLRLELLAAFRHFMTMISALVLLVSVRQAVLRQEDLSSTSAITPSEPEILSCTDVIAHAMGELDGYIYLNCLESFEAMYEQGTRVFEVDFAFTADGNIVLSHDWARWATILQEGLGDYEVPTTEEFLSKPILGAYTPLTLRDLLLLMDQYPDICIITDSKYTDAQTALTQFRIMADEAEALNLPDVFDRIIIQVYNPTMLEALDRTFHFPHYIFTLYNTNFDGSDKMLRDFAEYSAAHRVMGITMWDYLWNPSLQSIAEEYGLSIYVHTVNDLDQGRRFLAAGVSAIYTDSLTDSILAGGI